MLGLLTYRCTQEGEKQVAGWGLWLMCQLVVGVSLPEKAMSLFTGLSELSPWDHLEVFSPFCVAALPGTPHPNL